MHSFTFSSSDADQTRRLGQQLGTLAEPGLVVSLVGDLGAGKTTFTQGVAAGLHTPDPRLVTSPTFVLIQEYAGRIPLYHFDTYRLKDLREFVELGVEEYFQGDGICLVEWADRVESILPVERVEVTFESQGPTARIVQARSLGSRYDELVKRWESEMKRSH